MPTVVKVVTERNGIIAVAKCAYITKRKGYNGILDITTASYCVFSLYMLHILLNFSEIDQSYCSIEHSINFCHRDPNIGTKYNNIYLGCGKCNREQGGFSEKERIEQIARLVNSNKKHLQYLLSIL